MSRAPARDTGAGARAGFTLIEVMVALTLLVLMLSGVGAMTLAASQRSRLVEMVDYRNAVMQQQSNRLATLPYDSLPGAATCTTLSNVPIPHTRCVTVTAIDAKVRRVTLVITPTNIIYRPDTVVLDRANLTGYNPFNLP